MGRRILHDKAAVQPLDRDSETLANPLTHPSRTQNKTTTTP